MKCPSKPRPSILVVDDEPRVCQVIQRVLSQEGYAIITAGSGAEALARLREVHVALLVVDLKMPGMDGLELLRAVQPIRAGLPAILLTAYGTATAAREAMALGVCEFISKPFDNRLLKQVVKEVLCAGP